MWQQHQDFCAEVGDQGGVVVGLASKARVAAKLQDHATARLNIAQAIGTHLERGSGFYDLAVVFEAVIYPSPARVSLNALELSSFFRQHADKARASEVVEEAEQHLVSLAGQLPQDIYQQAVERGKTLHLRTILDQLRDELSDYATPPPLPTSSVDSAPSANAKCWPSVAAGRSNRQIARDLFLTLNTVKSHIHHVYGKLGVESRTQAVARASSRCSTTRKPRPARRTATTSSPASSS